VHKMHPTNCHDLSRSLSDAEADNWL